MKRVGDELNRLTGYWGNKDEASRIARRVAEVHAMWKDAVERLYKDRAPYVLSHTNAVYIKKEKGRKLLIVYMDDGGVRSDVHCQQHFLLMWLQEMHGEKIDVFKTLPSRFEMRNKHPYEEAASAVSSAKTKPSPPLSEAERQKVSQTAHVVEDSRVRAALEKAMNADLAWKKDLEE